MTLPITAAGGSGSHSNNRPLLFLVVAAFFPFGRTDRITAGSLSGG